MTRREFLPPVFPGAEAGLAFVVWKRYQRRAEVLAIELGSQAVFLPHIFRHKLLRPVDYLFKFVRTIAYLVRSRPQFVVIQAPPLFPALAAILAGTRYVIDVHNAQIEKFWMDIPLTGYLMGRAEALIAHNVEIQAVLTMQFPGSRVFTIPDPLAVIGAAEQPRDSNNLLVICSFDFDEPLDLLLAVIQALPEYMFTITADLKKLPQQLGAAFAACPNVRLTGFLSTPAYHWVLCHSKAAIVLTTLPQVQPSGACEALSSNTPLVLSRSALTQSLFGGWAQLVENEVESLVSAIRALSDARLDLLEFREQWNKRVSLGITDLQSFLSTSRFEPLKGRKPENSNGS